MATDRAVFISYAHEDSKWLDRLKVHFRPLVRRAQLDLWDDSRIGPGEAWHTEISKAIARASVAIPMVSADFLASDFIASNELPPLLHRAAEGGLVIVPLIVSPCLFAEHTELSRYQCVNSPDRPLSGMSPTDAEATLVSLGRSVERLFDQLDIRPDDPHAVHADPRVVERPLNLGFDGAAPLGTPVGWFDSFGHVSGVSTDYDIRIERRSANPADGTCAVLEKKDAMGHEFGSLMQRCPAGALAGRTVRLEGELRTGDVSGWAGLWLRADAAIEPNVFFDNMYNRPVIGTTNWTRYFIDAPLPAHTEWLNYGIVLAGSGTVYVDDIRLRVWTSEGRWEDV